MERFILTTKKTKGGRVSLVLEMRHAGDNSTLATWKIPYAGIGSDEIKVRVPMRLCERRGIFINAEWDYPPDQFDGSAREFINRLFDRNYDMGEMVITDHSEGMRLALAMVLAGRASTITKSNALTQELTNLPAECLLYWFGICFYGWRQKASRAALFTLLTASGDK
mgnify:CR=1 FL=1